MERVWFAMNNRATAADMDILGPLGIQMLRRSSRPMHAERDAETGRVMVALGRVFARRDGMFTIRPRADTTPAGVEVLIRTAVECLERDLHRRDDWVYQRATKRSCGFWSAVILTAVPEGESIFTMYADALRPASVSPFTEDDYGVEPVTTDQRSRAYS